MSQVDSNECLNAKATVDRLETVIDFLEKLQEGNYNPTYGMILSYLYDIRDGSVPDYVMNPKEKK